VRQDLRPERPDEEDAPQLTDAIWEITEKCWVKNPNNRPTAKAVCDMIVPLLDTTTVTSSTSVCTSHQIQSMPKSPTLDQYNPLQPSIPPPSDSHSPTKASSGRPISNPPSHLPQPKLLPLVPVQGNPPAPAPPLNPPPSLTLGHWVGIGTRTAWEYGSDDDGDSEGKSEDGHSPYGSDNTDDDDLGSEDSEGDDDPAAGGGEGEDDGGLGAEGGEGEGDNDPGAEDGGDDVYDEADFDEYDDL
jgi:hypothetical protein